MPRLKALSTSVRWLFARRYLHYLHHGQLYVQVLFGTPRGRHWQMICVFGHHGCGYSCTCGWCDLVWFVQVGIWILLCPCFVLWLCGLFVFLFLRVGLVHVSVLGCNSFTVSPYLLFVLIGHISFLSLNCFWCCYCCWNVHINKSWYGSWI